MTENIKEYPRLPSGKKYYANMGVIGIGPDHTITEGYDGTLGYNEGDYEAWYDWDQKDLEFIADLMIQRWTYFKENMSKIIKENNQ